MINIVRFCDTINFSLTNRGLTAYANYQETVEQVNLAQVSLMNAYRKLFEMSGNVTDAINPFKVTDTVALANGLLVPRQDWLFTVGVSFHDVYNDGCNVVHKDTEVPEMIMEQVVPSGMSSIRKPTISSPKRYFTDGVWAFQGRTVGTVKHLYVRRPVEAQIVATVNPDTLEEIPVSQVNLEWNNEELTQLMGICLYWRGVATQDEFIIQTAQQAPR